MQTAKARRGAIQTLANYAAGEGWIDPIGRLRRLKIVHGNPTGWTAEEVKTLMITCLDKSKSPYDRYHVFKNGLDRGQYIGTLIALLWDTRLRLGDAFKLSWKDLKKQPDGSFLGTTEMSKTEKTQTFSIKPETIELLKTLKVAIMPGKNPDDNVIPESTDRKQLYRMVKAYVVLSGITQGTLRFIRRGAASTGERIGVGARKALRGHRSNVSYLDPNIVGTKPIELPTISDVGPEMTYRPIDISDLLEYDQAMKVANIAMKFARRDHVTKEELDDYEKTWKPDYANLRLGCLHLAAPTMTAFLPDGSIVGFAECYDEFGWLPQIFVHPRYRRRGIGTELAFRLNRELNRGESLQVEMEMLDDYWVSPWIKEYLNSAGFERTCDDHEAILKMSQYKEPQTEIA
jgi:GNAT superfamily N-acetyltransferase